MADETDRAGDRIEVEEERALAAVLSRLPHGESATVCEGCVEPIPEERRTALRGVRLCVVCAQAQEIREARYG